MGKNYSKNPIDLSNAGPSLQQEPIRGYSNKRIKITNPSNPVPLDSNELAKDDEPLAFRKTTLTSTSSGEDLDISFKFCRNYLSPANEYQEWPCTLVFQAPESTENQRSGVDIICVIDVSGSMRGDKIELVKKTLEFMLTQVTEMDRISIVSFSNNASKLMPLSIMNERGKACATRVVSQLCAGGGTNIVAGLDLAIRIAVNRRVENSSTSIILLSDGHDNNSATACERAKSCIESHNHTNISYTIHSFGYGAEHDAKTLSEIAGLKNGGFYFVEKFETISEAFANCLGELLSAMVNEVEVTLSTQPCDLDFSLTKVYSSTGDIQFTMPNIMYGDTKEAVFVLGFKPSSIILSQEIYITPIRARVSYNLIKTSQKIVVERELVIKLKDAEEDVELDETVLVNFYRVKAAEVLKEAGMLGDAGKLVEARELLEKAANELRNSVVAHTELLGILISDLDSAKLRFRDRDAYEHGGRADINNKAMGHHNKRGEKVNMYQNTCQKRMQVESKSFFGS